MDRSRLQCKKPEQEPEPPELVFCPESESDPSERFSLSRSLSWDRSRNKSPPAPYPWLSILKNAGSSVGVK